MRNEDFVQLLERYLDVYESLTPLPDEIRDNVRAALPRIKQTASRKGPSRYLRMTFNVPAAARYGLAAAAVIAAVLLGATFFGGGPIDNIGGERSQPPSSSPSGMATPRADATSLVDAESDDDGNLPAGNYFLDHDLLPGRIDFQVPSGWWYFYDATLPETSTAHAILVNSLDSGAANGSAWGLAFTVVDEVWVDPCDRTAGSMDRSVTQSVDALVEAFSSWSEFPVTSVQDVTVGGFAGKRVEITRAEGTTCVGGPNLFETPTGYLFQPIFPSTAPIVNQLILLDVNGSLLTVWTTDYPARNEFEVGGGASLDPQAHVEDQVELHQILDSILIQPR
jgi:hypothetical protein